MGQNELNQLQLHIKLSQFGLNPKEWSLKPLSRFTVLIANKTDPNFKLRGRWKNKRHQALWQSVQVISI